MCKAKRLLCTPLKKFTIHFREKAGILDALQSFLDSLGATFGLDVKWTGIKPSANFVIPILLEQTGQWAANLKIPYHYRKPSKEFGSMQSQKARIDSWCCLLYTSDAADE